MFQSGSKIDAQKSLATLAVTQFDIPGDTRFPLNAFMGKPANRSESGKDGHSVMCVTSCHECCDDNSTVWHNHMCTLLYKHTCSQTCLHTNTHTQIYTCTHAYTHTHTHVHTHTHTQTHTPAALVYMCTCYRPNSTHTHFRSTAPIHDSAPPRAWTEASGESI